VIGCACVFCTQPPTANVQEYLENLKILKLALRDVSATPGIEDFQLFVPHEDNAFYHCGVCLRQGHVACAIPVAGVHHRDEVAEHMFSCHIAGSSAQVNIRIQRRRCGVR
jgi:hypothetical protein